MAYLLERNPQIPFEEEFADRGTWGREFTNLGFRLLSVEKDDGKVTLSGVREEDGTIVEMTFTKKETGK